MMRTKLQHLLFVLLLAIAVTVALPGSGFAQDCNSSLYQMREGSSFTLTSYDANKKPVSRVVHTYSKVNKSGNSVTARVHQEMFDEKDQSVSKGDYEIYCRDGVVRLDIKDMMGAGASMKDANIKMEMSGDAMEIPYDMTVGQKLKDATLHMKGTMGQTTIINQDMKLRDRKVEAKETVVTPAGKFESYKVSYLTEMPGMMGKPMTMKTITWYAKGPGMVKTESYDAKGKLTGYTLLTKYTK